MMDFDNLIVERPPTAGAPPRAPHLRCWTAGPYSDGKRPDAAEGGRVVAIEDLI